MKIYNVTGYLIILAYMLACMYFAPAHLGPWLGIVDRRSLLYLLLVSWRVVFGRSFFIWESRIARSTIRNGS